MSNASVLSNIDYPALKELRSTRYRFKREDSWHRDISMRRFIDRAWPFLVVAVSTKRLPTAFQTMSLDDILLYRLAHPDDFDSEAVLRFIQSGRTLSAEEKDDLIDRQRARAKSDFALFDPSKDFGFPGIGVETRRYIAAFSAKKRYELLMAYDPSNSSLDHLEEPAQGSKPKLNDLQQKVERHRKKME